MRRLTPLVARSNDHEDGAVAVLVAILSVVLFGLVALAVDVGALYQERRELQNGADAGALAIAEDCVRDVIDCTVGGIEEEILADGTAQDYADDNAEDQVSHVENVDLDPASGTVTVDLLTEDPGGDTVLYHWFAPVLGIEASEVRASATAAWGPPAGLRIFPMSFCIGKFNEVTNDGTDYGWPVDPEDGYKIHYHHDDEDEDVDCELEDDSENENYPGGFGWIDVDVYDEETDEDCHLLASEEQWYEATTGVGLPAASPWDACFDFIDDKVDDVNHERDNGEEDPCADPDSSAYVEPVLVPIFNKHRGEGDSGEIYVEGFGAFCPTGFNFGGHGSNPDKKVCGHENNRCMRGWFSEFVEFEEAVAGGSSDFGVGTFGLTE